MINTQAYRGVDVNTDYCLVITKKLKTGLLGFITMRILRDLMFSQQICGRFKSSKIQQPVGG
jgi:hypothetical protein